MATNYQISDPINRALALGYVPAPSVRGVLFPELMLDIEAEKLVDFGDDTLDADTDWAGEDADMAELVARYTSRDILVRHRMKMAVVPYFKQGRAGAGGIDLQARTLTAVMRRMDNGAERYAATLATTPGNYGVNTQALAGTDQFNHVSSEPVDLFRQAMTAIEDGTLGYSPNLAVMSSDVADVLRHHPALYASLGLGDTVRRSLSDAELASAIGVQTVAVTRHRYVSSAGATVRSWDNVLILAYTDFGGQVDGAPTFGVNAKLKNSPFIGPWFDLERRHARGAKVIISETPQILTPLAGYLFTDCLL